MMNDIAIAFTYFINLWEGWTQITSKNFKDKCELSNYVHIYIQSVQCYFVMNYYYDKYVKKKPLDRDRIDSKWDSIFENAIVDFKKATQLQEKTQIIEYIKLKFKEPDYLPGMKYIFEPSKTEVDNYTLLAGKCMYDSLYNYFKTNKAEQGKLYYCNFTKGPKGNPLDFHTSIFKFLYLLADKTISEATAFSLNSTSMCNFCVLSNKCTQLNIKVSNFEHNLTENIINRFDSKDNFMDEGFVTARNKSSFSENESDMEEGHLSPRKIEHLPFKKGHTLKNTNARFQNPFENEDFHVMEEGHLSPRKIEHLAFKKGHTLINTNARFKSHFEESNQ